MTERKRVFRGDRLREARVRQGLSQQDFAVRMGFPQTQLARYETNKSDPSSEILLRMSRELKVTTDWLLGNTDIPDIPVFPPDLSSSELRLIAAYRQRDLKEIMIIATES